MPVAILLARASGRYLKTILQAQALVISQYCRRADAFLAKMQFHDGRLPLFGGYDILMSSFRTLDFQLVLPLEVSSGSP